MAEEKKIIPEYPALIGGSLFDNGAGSDYTTQSNRLNDKFYKENTGGFLDPINNANQRLPYAGKIASALPKAMLWTGEQILNIPSYVNYGTGLLSYGIDKAIGGIEPGGMDYYDYIPHAEVDIARGRVPYSTMPIKPYGTMLKKGLVDTPIEWGKQLWSEGFTKDSWNAMKNVNPWLTPDSAAYDKTKVRNLPDPESIQNTIEWGLMGLTSGTGYFAKVPVLTKLMMNKKYVQSGLAYGTLNSAIKENFSEENFIRSGSDSGQTMALVGLNLLTDLGMRGLTKNVDKFMRMGLSKQEANSLNKNLPELQKMIAQSLKDDKTPIQAWQMINDKMNMPGLKAYLRLMIQSEPRFKEIITEQFVDINRGFDAIFDSAIIQNDRLLGGQRIFDRNIDVFEVAQNVMGRYVNQNTALNKKWRDTIGEKQLNKPFSINEVSRIQETINGFKQSTQYKGLAGREKKEFDSFLAEIMQGENMTLNKIDNLIRAKYNKFRNINEGQDITSDMSFSAAHKHFKKIMRDELGGINPKYKQATDNYNKAVNQFIESTPAYRLVNDLKSLIKKNDPEAVIDKAIEGMYNPKLNRRQLNEVMDMLEQFGGASLLPDLMRIKIQQTAKEVFRASDDVSQRSGSMTKAMFNNKVHQEIYRGIVERIGRTKGLDKNDSAQIVSVLLPYFEQASLLNKLPTESMTGLFTQFQKEMGVGALKSINPLEWSQVVKDKYRDWNIEKMANLMTDDNFLPLIIDLKRSEKSNSFIYNVIQNYILTNAKGGARFQLTQDEYRTAEYKRERSNAYYNANKNNNKSFSSQGTR